MAKQYMVTVGALGNFPHGHVLTAEEQATIPADRLTALVAQGALTEATADQLAAHDMAHDLPTGTSAKAATLDADSVTLTTGQPGGAPVPNTAQAAEDAADATGRGLSGKK